jgi:hypothetical protein
MLEQRRIFSFSKCLKKLISDIFSIAVDANNIKKLSLDFGISLRLFQEKRFFKIILVRPKLSYCEAIFKVIIFIESSSSEMIFKQ